MPNLDHSYGSKYTHDKSYEDPGNPDVLAPYEGTGIKFVDLDQNEEKQIQPDPPPPIQNPVPVFVIPEPAKEFVTKLKVQSFTLPAATNNVGIPVQIVATSRVSRVITIEGTNSTGGYAYAIGTDPAIFNLTPTSSGGTQCINGYTPRTDGKFTTRTTEPLYAVAFSADVNVSVSIEIEQEI